MKLNNYIQKIIDTLDISLQELQILFKPSNNPERNVKRLLYFVGVLFSFILVIGALWGFKRAYKRFPALANQNPVLSPLHRITKAAMILGAIRALLIVFTFQVILAFLAKWQVTYNLIHSPILFTYILVNFIACLICFLNFRNWQHRIEEFISAQQRFGSARLASGEELQDLYSAKGIYVGNDFYRYNKFGHYLLCAGARSGKGTNILVPNLLGKGNYQGSWVVLDIKGELTAITARYQKEIGQDVIILDPWAINGTPSATYNPLDLIDISNPDTLSDDADILAQMIVPVNPKSSDPFWDDRARTIISGLILHLFLTVEPAERNISLLWSWLRQTDADWFEMIASMSVSANPIVAGIGKDIVNMKTTNDKLYGSVMSIAQNHTDFLKSKALQASMATSSFNIKNLTQGKTTLYVIIPADKLSSNAKWLRLVTTTAIQSVVRNHNKRVTFMIDEFAALGHLPAVEIGLGAYAGYNLSLWPVIQNLGQIKNLYGDNWTTFIANTSLQIYTGVSDEFTMNTLSNIAGDQTVVTYKSNAMGVSQPHPDRRKLFTPDEIRRGSSDNIFLFLEQKPITYFPKLPYYKMPDVQGRFDDNPYMTSIDGNKSL